MANHKALSGEQVRAMRLRLGENQTVFGNRFGVDQSAVSVWERLGAPRRGASRIMLEQLHGELGAERVRS